MFNTFKKYNVLSVVYCTLLQSTTMLRFLVLFWISLFCLQGGRDNEIYEDSFTIGHKVTGSEDNMKQVSDIFFNKK